MQGEAGPGADASAPERKRHPESYYRTIKPIGKGSFGTVALVQCRRDQQLYVMKRVAYRAGDQGSKQHKQLMTEVRMLRKLRHPNIVEFREAFISKTQVHLCIVMAYCDSGDLHQRIKAAQEARQHLSETQIMDWFIQLILALHYLHSNHVLHRDIKPQNVFLTQAHKVVKMGDFGVSSALEHTMALARTRIGTPYYMSPEMCQGAPYGWGADIWALGVVAYQLLALALPFTAASLPELVSAITTEAPAPLPRHYSSDLRSIVLTMLLKDPAQRPTTKRLLRHPYIRTHLQSFVSRYAAPTPAPAPAPGGPQASASSPTTALRALPPAPSQPQPAPGPPQPQQQAPLPPAPSLPGGAPVPHASIGAGSPAHPPRNGGAGAVATSGPPRADHGAAASPTRAHERAHSPSRGSSLAQQQQQQQQQRPPADSAAPPATTPTHRRSRGFSGGAVGAVGAVGAGAWRGEEIAAPGELRLGDVMAAPLPPARALARPEAKVADADDVSYGADAKAAIGGGGGGAGRGGGVERRLRGASEAKVPDMGEAKGDAALAEDGKRSPDDAVVARGSTPGRAARSSGRTPAAAVAAAPRADEGEGGAEEEAGEEEEEEEEDYSCDDLEPEEEEEEEAGEEGDAGGAAGAGAAVASRGPSAGPRRTGESLAAAGVPTRPGAPRGPAISAAPAPPAVPGREAADVALVVTWCETMLTHEEPEEAQRPAPRQLPPQRANAGEDGGGDGVEEAALRSLPYEALASSTSSAVAERM